jgi:Protein of unknown function (DUF3168)
VASDYGLLYRIALLGLLKADTVLQGLVGVPPRIYDDIPQGTVTPYIRLGDDLVLDYGDKSLGGQEFTSSIHTFDGSPTQRGQERLNRIQGRIYELLHEREQLIQVGDRNVYLIRFLDRITRNLDGTNWHGIDRYRVLI